VVRQVAISEAAMERHASNTIHLAIAIASISILARRRWLCFGSLACLAAGIVVGLI
jgi:hypothetical protein